MKESGLSEDQIFELVVCAAIGQATRQYQSALGALDPVIGAERTLSMRLKVLNSGYSLGTKPLFAVIHLASRRPVPDAAKLVFYRPDFYGGPMKEFTHEAMRGPSAWSVGDRELMAAFVSQTNECAFCIGAHTATAVGAYHDEARSQLCFPTFETAPIEEPLRATLRMQEADPGARRRCDRHAREYSAPVSRASRSRTPSRSRLRSTPPTAWPTPSGSPCRDPRDSSPAQSSYWLAAANRRKSGRGPSIARPAPMPKAD